MAEAADDLIGGLGEWRGDVENGGVAIDVSGARVMVDGECQG